MKPRPFPYETSSYPFSDSSTFQITKELYFPLDFIVDAHIYAYKSKIYEIVRIVKTINKLTLHIDTRDGTEKITGNFDIPIDDKPSNNSIDLFDGYGRRAGVLIIGSLESISFLPNGDYKLSSGTIKFEVSCHIPIRNDTVNGFLVNGKLVSGDAQFVGTQGVILERSTETGNRVSSINQAGNTITVNFTGEPYYNLWDIPDMSDYFSRFVAKVNLTVRNPAKNYSESILLEPDKNGNIPIYVRNAGVFEEGALRIAGTKGRLTIKLAK